MGTCRNLIIWSYQLGWQCELATVLKEIRKLTFRALALRRSEFAPMKGLTPETSVFESLYGGQKSHYQPSRWNQIILLYFPPTQHHNFFRNLPLYSSVGTCTGNPGAVSWRDIFKRRDIFRRKLTSWSKLSPENMASSRLTAPGSRKMLKGWSGMKVGLPRLAYSLKD